MRGGVWGVYACGRVCMLYHENIEYSVAKNEPRALS